MAIEITIDHMSGTPTPTIVFGFSTKEFSQCVYLQVDSDPLKCVEMANQMHDAFVAACGRAVSEHKTSLTVVPDTFQSHDA
jgi:hypothetical protein